jgi:hypothetical protein
MRNPTPGGIYTERFKVLRKERQKDRQGGDKVTLVELETLDGRLVDSRIGKEQFADQNRLKRQGTVLLVDTIGVTADDVLQDLDRVQWDIIALAQRGEFVKELGVREAG